MRTWYVCFVPACHLVFHAFAKRANNRTVVLQKMIEKLEAKSVHLFPKTDTNDASATPAPSRTSGSAPEPDHDLGADIARVSAPEIDMDM